MYKTIIIGGGAAGLFTAANLTSGKNLLIEGGKRLGQKILITGGGMCNITNMDSTEDFLTRFGDKKKSNFLKAALLNFPTKANRDWLKSIGLGLEIRDDGKVFPETLKAQTVIDFLQREISKNGTLIKYNSKVLSIQKQSDCFIVNCGTDNYKAKNIVLATGGKSYPETGSDGSGYILAKSLGHKIIDPTQALVGIKVENYPFKNLSGSSVKGSNIEFFRNSETKRYLQKTGDVLFTHHGLSGPGILNNSRFIDKADLLAVSIISCNNKEEKRTEIMQILNSASKITIKKILKELGLTASMVESLCSYLDIPSTSTGKELNKKVKSKLVNHLLSFPFKVSSKLGFNASMVTAGGVDITEIDRKTMESKILPGLFLAGEIMDIDGDTGGYNIQAAFSTSKLIVDKLN
ncbi:MAG: NAD(P)/FAD-dependent oxidoreductase [Spirochaetaceae bacterium]